ncbi:hypothetical protein PE36_13419 [Moritella sp. PE36]|nr:hypothetical protein PE36_13419 [Moritella sp. PE36]
MVQINTKLPITDALAIKNTRTDLFILNIKGMIKPLTYLINKTVFMNGINLTHLQT